MKFTFVKNGNDSDKRLLEESVKEKTISKLLGLGLLSGKMLILSSV
jgi:hypothetical protein